MGDLYLGFIDRAGTVDDCHQRLPTGQSIAPQRSTRAGMQFEGIGSVLRLSRPGPEMIASTEHFIHIRPVSGPPENEFRIRVDSHTFENLDDIHRLASARSANGIRFRGNPDGKLKIVFWGMHHHTADELAVQDGSDWSSASPLSSREGSPAVNTGAWKHTIRRFRFPRNEKT